MNSPDISKRSELDICKVLIGHYVAVQESNEEALAKINQTIEQQLKLRPLEAAAAYENVLSKVE